MTGNALVAALSMAACPSPASPRDSLDDIVDHGRPFTAASPCEFQDVENARAS